MRINKTFVDTINPEMGKASSTFYRDSALPGFALRVSPGGTKAFVVEKKVMGKARRVTLGRYPIMTPEQARKKAHGVIQALIDGKDPQAERRAESARGVTLKEVFDDYLATHRDLRPSTVNDYTKILNTNFVRWQSKAMANISKDMVEKMHREIGTRSPARANNAMRVLRALFNHALQKYEDADGNPILKVNPVERLNHTRAWYRIERRTRWIKPHQLGAWYQAVMQLNNTISRDYFIFLLFTGLRRTEATCLQWADVDFTDRTFTVRETKNRKIHTLPMSDYLEVLLKRLDLARQNEWVFPSNRHSGHLIEPKSALEKVVSISGIEFSLHDLRRTFITIAESLDISHYALKRLMNHTDNSDVTAGYIILDVERLRDPMQKISKKLLESINQQPTSNVILLGAENISQEFRR